MDANSEFPSAALSFKQGQHQHPLERFTLNIRIEVRDLIRRFKSAEIQLQAVTKVLKRGE